MREMAAEQRREAIRRMVAENPSVSQQAIAAAIGVSQKTVSRDLEQLKRGPDLVVTNSSGRGRPRGTVVKLHVNGGRSPGEELVARLRAEMAVKSLEPDAREEGLLDQIRRTADLIRDLELRLDVDGLTFAPDKKGGPPRLNPAVAEIRQQRLVLARLLSQISLEESVKNPVKQRAANTRWRRHNLAAAARYGGSDG